MSELLRTADELARMDVHSRTPWITNAVDQLRMADKTIAGLKHDFSDLEVEFARAVQKIDELRSTPPASPDSKPSVEDARDAERWRTMMAMGTWTVQVSTPAEHILQACDEAIARQRAGGG